VEILIIANMSHKLFYTLDGIVLYTSFCFLSKRLSYSKFIEKADKLNFLPYTLLFEEMPSTKSLAGCRMEIIFIPQTLFFMTPFSDIIFLNRGIVKYSKKEREIVIEAGIGGIMIFILLLYGLIMIGSAILAVATSNFLILSVTAVIFILLISIYRRDVRRFERIKNIALEEKEIP
jgi:hypothetical protein